PSRHAASASGATAPRFGASRWRWPCKDSSNSSVERAVDRQNVRSVRYRTFVLSSSGCPLALSTQKPPLDSSYLEKLQDYYAEHKVIPSYSVLASLRGSGLSRLDARPPAQARRALLRATPCRPAGAGGASQPGSRRRLRPHHHR